MDQKPSLEQVKAVANLKFSADAVLMDMMPVEMRDLVESGRSLLSYSASEIDRLDLELTHLRKALDKYAAEGVGMDPMFAQNFSLCLQQVRAGK